MFMEFSDIIISLYILVLSIFLGFELISKIPSTLHTPLMSASNAISGITILGALLIILKEKYYYAPIPTVIGFIALIFATINLVGGYTVTDRMLKMFKKKDKK